MKKYLRSVSMVGIFALLAMESAHAGGIYLSGELGLNLGRSLNTDAHDSDRSSVCDEFINPQYRTVNDTTGWGDTNCIGPNRGSASTWKNAFEGGAGGLYAAALGYTFRNFRYRAELEYFYQNSAYDQVSEVTLGGGEVLTKIVQEIVRADERIGSVSSYNLFVNVYRDFPTASPFTPYIGIGMGAGHTAIDYSGVFARDIDPAGITTGNAPEGGHALPNAAEIQARLAGTTTTENAKLKDLLFGYQVIAGFEYELSRNLETGIKFRWVAFGAFDDSGEWDQLRSHPSNLRRDGSEPVSYGVSFDKIEFLGADLNFRYRL